VGGLTLLVVGVPTDIIDTPLFSREIPVRWWEYPVLAATAVLTAAWFAIQRPPTSEGSDRKPLAGVLLTVFAVGCPVCNKLVLVALGTSGALSVWAPLQRSEEHTSELQSRENLVCRLLLEKKKIKCTRAKK